MRVLLVNAHGTDPSYGGAERRARYLASGLTARGHDVEVLSAFPQRSDPDVPLHVLHRTDWRDDPVRRLRNHAGDVVSAPWPRLGRRLDAIEPDVIHTHNLSGIGTGVWEAARRGGIPVVHSILDYYLLCPRTTLRRPDGSPCRPHPLLCGARTRRLARWHRGVDTVLGTSNYVLRAHEGLFPGAVQRKMAPPQRPLAGPMPEPVQTPPAVLGYMGALTAEKGVELLIDAAPSLARSGLTLRVAGDGPLRHAVTEAENVSYAGRLEGEALARFVGSCDAGIVPSLWAEPGGGPFVIGEWLGAGRPVLTTPRGGLAEAQAGGGVLVFGETAADLVAAASGLRDAGDWGRLLATVPAIDGEAELGRWLDRHEEVYAAALGRRDAARRAGAGRGAE